MENNPLMKIEQSVPSTVSNNASTEPLFTTRLQLLQNLSTTITGWKAEDNPGINKPEPGEFWLGPPGGQCLKKEFHAICISWRDHALQLRNSETVCESYISPPKGVPPKNVDEQIFAKVSGLPKQSKDEKGRPLTNMWGKDVLFWVPDYQKFAIMFFHSTARPCAANAFVARGKLLVVRSQFVETQSFSWYTPEIAVYSKAIEAGSIKLPNEAEVKEEMTKFLNPNPRGEGRESTTEEGRVR